MYSATVIRKNTHRAKLIVAQMYNGTNENIYKLTKEHLRLALVHLTSALELLEHEEQRRIDAALNPKRTLEDKTDA